MNTLFNNFDFIQNILTLHQQLKDNEFSGTLQIHEDYLTLEDSSQKVVYDLITGR